MCRNCANNYAQLREKYAKDPCPLGEISQGTIPPTSPPPLFSPRVYQKHFVGYARHRALLYKYLADSMSLPARIHTNASALRAPDTGTDAKESHVHASGLISIVEVYLENERKWCVVDLVKDVGELYEEESPRAQEYKQIGIELEEGMLPPPPPGRTLTLNIRTATQSRASTRNPTIQLRT